MQGRCLFYSQSYMTCHCYKLTEHCFNLCPQNSLCFLSYFLNPLSQMACPRVGSLYQDGHIIKKKIHLFFFQHLTSDNGSLNSDETFANFSLPFSSILGLLFFSGVGLVHKITTAVSLYVQLFCCAQKTLFTCIRPASLALTIFLPPPLTIFLPPPLQNPCVIWGRGVI